MHNYLIILGAAAVVSFVDPPLFVLAGVSKPAFAPRNSKASSSLGGKQKNQVLTDDVAHVNASFVAPPLAQAAEVDDVVDAPLMNDIQMLSDILAEVVKKDNPRVHELYTQLRQHGIERASDPDNVEAFEQMKKLAYDLTPFDALGVMRTFSIALNLVNAAEVHHRLRVMRQNELSSEMKSHVGPLPITGDSVRGTIDVILDGEEAVTKDEIFNKLIHQKVEIVLTAHPTEVNRKSLLRKYRKITEILGLLDRPELHPYERTVAITDLRRLVATLWSSDEIRRQKPTPQNEALGGIAVIESVLWEAVPAYLRKLDAQCYASLGRRALSDSQPYASTTIGTRLDNASDQIQPLFVREELLSPLMVIHRSLVEAGLEILADGKLSDVIRRVQVFGMTLVPLDIREESTKHTLALDAITRYLGVGSYQEWDEEARLNFLQSELSSKRSLFLISDLDTLGFDEGVLTTLKTFMMASNLERESLGAYVISQAQTASDVLAVMLLQKQFGMTSKKGNRMRVVPLFETLNDLTNADDVLETLFSISSYVGAVKSKQEVMVGYSDSAKDAGRLAACWAQYTAQEKMAKVATKHNIELTFFHGKGGTVGRGGNPALYRAILSHPPNTVNGRFRVTEQGEMIRQNFGSPAIAERTMDIYTAAVLREAFTKQISPTQSWRDQMQRVSDASCAGYRHLVREEPRFVPYFRQATPELELGSLNIGSRPAKRNPKGGIESLRAIPWTFAWTQTRTHLSAWLGVSDGLNAKDEKDQKELKEMYKQWPWFRESIDLIAMILSKTDFSISKMYDELLVEKTGGLLELGEAVRNKLVDTRQAVLDVTGSHDVQGPHVQLLRASTKIRNPYVDSINVVQAELLKEIRQMGDDESLSPEMREVKEVRKDALVVSINGIAQGMRNSG
eukprot:scaffold79760_cov57-Attheya_sp.AAC.9